MIAVIDYGMGNLRSVEKALEQCGADVIVTSDGDEILRADKVVFPGVGAFPKCMERLEELQLTGPIKKDADEKPFLGICLGLQALFTAGYEGGFREGLDIIKGKVVRFSPGVKIPHMGWNQVRFPNECPIFKGIDDETYFYFVHSYYVIPEDAAITAGQTVYTGPFVSAIWRDNLYAVQFHPEKSQENGLKILRNFVNL